MSNSDFFTALIEKEKAAKKNKRFNCDESTTGEITRSTIKKHLDEVRDLEREEEKRKEDAILAAKKRREEEALLEAKEAEAAKLEEEKQRKIENKKRQEEYERERLER